MASDATTTSSPASPLLTIEEDTAGISPQIIEMALHPSSLRMDFPAQAYGAALRVGDCDRARLLAQYIMASELGNNELSELQTHVTHFVEYTKRVRPSRLTIVIDPQTPMNPQNHRNPDDGVPFFIFDDDEDAVDAQGAMKKKKLFDVMTPFARPRGLMGLRLAKKAMEFNLGLLAYGMEKESLELFTAMNTHIMPCHVTTFPETLVANMADTPTAKKQAQRLSSPIPDYEDELRGLKAKYDATMKRIQSRTEVPLPSASASEEGQSRPESPSQDSASEEVLKLVESMTEIKEKLESAKNKLQKYVESEFYTRVNSDPLDFFNAKRYQLHRDVVDGVTEFADDTLFKSPILNPGDLISAFGAYHNCEMVALRVVYLGELDWSEYLLPPHIDGEPTYEAIAEAENTRFDLGAVMDRMYRGRIDTLNRYDAQIKKIEEVLKKKDESITPPPPERVPVKPTVMHFHFHASQLGDFFQSIHTCRTKHVRHRTLVIKNAYQRAIQDPERPAADQ